MGEKQLKTDASQCRDCQACMLACSLFHEGECNLGLARLRVHKDMRAYTFEITLCRHCDPPDCLLACPVEAIRLDARGIAVLFSDDCIQCGACVEACPYQSLYIHEPTGRYLKCDLCLGREDGPACAQMCPVGAVTYA